MEHAATTTEAALKKRAVSAKRALSLHDREDVDQDWLLKLRQAHPAPETLEDLLLANVLSETGTIKADSEAWNVIRRQENYEIALESLKWHRATQAKNSNDPIGENFFNSELWSAIEILSETDPEILLFVADELDAIPRRKLGGILGVSESTVSRKIRSAKERLKRYLAPSFACTWMMVFISLLQMANSLVIRLPCKVFNYLIWQRSQKEKNHEKHGR